MKDDLLMLLFLLVLAGIHVGVLLWMIWGVYYVIWKTEAESKKEIDGQAQEKERRFLLYNWESTLYYVQYVPSWSCVGDLFI